MPDVIPPERLAPYGATPAKLRPYAGLKEEYYLADFEPDEAVLGELGLDPARADRRRPHAAGGVALPPLREPAVRRGARPPARRRRRSSSRARPSSAPSSRRLHRPRARDRRAVADRVRRPRDLRRRHDEPRGGRARHAGVDHVRGPPGRGRRGADRRRPAAPTHARRGHRTGRASGASAERDARDPPCGRSCCLSPIGGSKCLARAAAGPRISAMRRRIRSAAFPVHRHALPQVALDAGLVALAYFLAYRLRFDGGVPPRYEDLFDRTIAFAIFGSILIFAVSGCTGTGCGTRRSASTCRSPRRCGVGDRARRLRRGHAAEGAAHARGVRRASSVPTGVLVLYGLLMLVLLGGVRYVAHLVYERPLRGYRAQRGARSVLIVGAGDGGRLLLREILRNPDLGYRPVGFIDDDQRKRSARIDRGLEVLGTTQRAPARARRRRARRGPDRDPVGAGHAARARRQRVPRARRPGPHDADRVRAAAERRRSSCARCATCAWRTSSAASRCGWRPSAPGATSPAACVLVTGAGGSIGAELCRQISRVGPAQLVLIDHAEDNLFEIERELVEDRHALNTSRCSPTARKRSGCARCSREHRPTVVFHAAAYKHVGLMEANPVEAVRNNALATRVMARVAGDIGTKVFVLVSTDKAVVARDRDGRVEGARRVGHRGRRPPLSRTRRSRAVRFGNVLGSSGSVVPIFRRQIAAGGPVTVTDSRDDALLHDDPGGGAAGDPPGLARARRRGVRARDGRAGEDPRPGEGHDPLLRLEPGKDIAIEIIGRAAGREAPRGAVQHVRATGADAGAARSCAPSGRRSTPRGSRRRSARSGCWCSKATRPRWPRRSPSWRRARSAGSQACRDGPRRGEIGSDSAADRIAS